MRAGPVLEALTQISLLARGLRNSASLTKSTRSFASHPFEAESLEEIRARIFGNRIGNGLRSGAKLLKKKLIGEKIASYYPEPISKFDPMYINLRAERYSSCASASLENFTELILLKANFKESKI